MCPDGTVLQGKECGDTSLGLCSRILRPHLYETSMRKKNRLVNQVELLCNCKTFCDAKTRFSISRCVGSTCGVGMRLGFVEVLKPDRFTNWSMLNT